MAEWSKTLVQIQVEISPLQTQVQIPLGLYVKINIIISHRKTSVRDLRKN